MISFVFSISERFYLGVLSCLWFIGWVLYAYNSPSEHPRITYSEKLYLLRCIPKQKKVKTLISENRNFDFVFFILVSNTMASYFHLCAIVWYCYSTYLYKFCFLYITDIITNIFFNNSSI
jgi:hypothetical protein